METPYLNDCYLREWEAEVIKSDRKDDKAQFIVLDKTAFYPNSGGQPHDTGIMIRLSDKKVFKVVFVGKFSGSISHEVECPGGARLNPGDKVRCTLDWERRYKLMRSHTAAHIISAVIHGETGAMITGNQLDTEKCRIDFSVPDFDREKLKGYEERANGIVRRNLPITFDSKSREEVLKDPSMVKLAKGLEHLPPEIRTLRLVRIGDFDCQADGGTHVKSTKEVGKIRFIDFVNKGASNRRIYFELE